MNKAFKVLVCALMLALCMGGIFASGSAEQDKLIIWDKSEYVGAYNELARARFEEFCAANGVEGEYVIVPPNDLRQRLYAAIEGGNPPDIVVTDDFMAKQFAGMGQLADVSDIKTSLPFIQAGLNVSFCADGEYIVPIAMLAPGLYLRADKWAEAGLDYPTTWEELREDARIINDPENDFYALGYPMGTSGGGDAEGMCRAVILAFGGVPVDAEGNVTVNSPETLAALEFIASLYEEGLCPPSAITWDDMGNNTAYLAGSVGVIQNSGSLYSQLRTDNPELFENTIILPFMAGPAGSFAPTGSNCFIIFENGGSVDMAKKYVTEFFDMDFYKNLVIQMGGMWQPVIEGADDDPFWEDPENSGWLANSLGGVPNTYPAPVNDATNRAFSEQVCVRAVQKIVLQGMDPQQALNELEADFNRILGK